MITKRLLVVACLASILSACSTNRYGDREFIGWNSMEWIGVGGIILTAIMVDGLIDSEACTFPCDPDGDPSVTVIINGDQVR